MIFFFPNLSHNLQGGFFYMEEPYVPSHMEEHISKEYIKRGILQPGDLTITNIVNKFDIQIYHHPYASFSTEDAGIRFIFINTNLPIMEFKKVFFHELCHLLRHVGEQDQMPYPFRELQEWEADNFIKYAMIPYHMLSYFKEDDIYYTSELFNVSVKVCRDRMLSLQARRPYKKNYIFHQLVPALSGC